MRRFTCGLTLAVCLFAGVNRAAAQDSPAPGKELRAVRITGESPKIDGRFDEEVWLTRRPIDDFTQQEPDNMAAPRERTVVQVAYDDRFLYVAARCYARGSRRRSAPASAGAAAFRRATRSASRSTRATTI